MGFLLLAVGWEHRNSFAYGGTIFTPFCPRLYKGIQPNSFQKQLQWLVQLLGSIVIVNGITGISEHAFELVECVCVIFPEFFAVFSVYPVWRQTMPRTTRDMCSSTDGSKLLHREA